MAQGGTAPAKAGCGILRTANEFELAYVIFRVIFGMDIFMHGAIRLMTGLAAWENPQAAVFETTPLPMWIVHGFLYPLPFFEVAIGLMTLFGFYTMLSYLLGAAMMVIIVFGNTVRQDWTTVGNNLHYVLYYCLLIAAIRYNTCALDGRRR